MSCFVENVEKSSEVDLSPAIVVALHDANTLNEGERRSE
jgi:hypothetical protein